MTLGGKGLLGMRFSIVIWMCRYSIQQTTDKANRTLPCISDASYISSLSSSSKKGITPRNTLPNRTKSNTTLNLSSEIQMAGLVMQMR